MLRTATTTAAVQPLLLVNGVHGTCCLGKLIVSYRCIASALLIVSKKMLLCGSDAGMQWNVLTRNESKWKAARR